METTKRRRRGCPGDSMGKPMFGLHKWKYSTSWNGNDGYLSQFIGSRGIGRRGWRCYHCGRFVWAVSDRDYYALALVRTGVLKLPAALQQSGGSE